MTLIDQELRDYADFIVKDKGVGLINASVLAHGLLIDGDLPAWLSTADPELVDASRKAVSLSRDKGFKIERLAYGYSAREGEKLGVSVLLTGPDNFEQLDANIQVIDEGLTPDESAFCDHLRSHYFAKLKVHNWGDADVEKHRRKVVAAREKLAASQQPSSA